jgi:hypothetical protein
VPLEQPVVRVVVRGRCPPPFGHRLSRQRKRFTRSRTLVDDDRIGGHANGCRKRRIDQHELRTDRTDVIRLGADEA